MAKQIGMKETDTNPSPIDRIDDQAFEESANDTTADQALGDESLPQTGSGGMNDTEDDVDDAAASVTTQDASISGVDTLEAGDVTELETGVGGQQDSDSIQTVESDTDTTDVRKINDRDDEENNPAIKRGNISY